MSNNRLIPKCCLGVKCHVPGCLNLSSHKIGELNIYDNRPDTETNDELEVYQTHQISHPLTVYLCDEHFNSIMTREERVFEKDDRFAGRKGID